MRGLVLDGTKPAIRDDLEVREPSATESAVHDLHDGKLARGVLLIT